MEEACGGGPRVPWTTLNHATNAVHGSPVEPTANEGASANSSSAAREGEKMKPRSFRMPFSPHLIVFLLPPENPYMKTSLDGSKSPTRIEFDRLDAENQVAGTR
jgi:hypothetical protein